MQKMKIDWQKKNIALGGWAKGELEREVAFFWQREVGCDYRM
jgi:hypothetical protein